MRLKTQKCVGSANGCVCKSLWNLDLSLGISIPTMVVLRICRVQGIATWGETGSINMC
jgi:hypothetical protein